MTWCNASAFLYNAYSLLSDMLRWLDTDDPMPESRAANLSPQPPPDARRLTEVAKTFPRSLRTPLLLVAAALILIEGGRRLIALRGTLNVSRAIRAALPPVVVLALIYAAHSGVTWTTTAPGALAVVLDVPDTGMRT